MLFRSELHRVLESIEAPALNLLRYRGSDVKLSRSDGRARVQMRSVVCDESTIGIPAIMSRKLNVLTVDVAKLDGTRMALQMLAAESSSQLRAVCIVSLHADELKSLAAVVKERAGVQFYVRLGDEGGSPPSQSEQGQLAEHALRRLCPHATNLHFPAEQNLELQWKPENVDLD